MPLLLALAQYYKAAQQLTAASTPPPKKTSAQQGGGGDQDPSQVRVMVPERFEDPHSASSELRRADHVFFHEAELRSHFTHLKAC